MSILGIWEVVGWTMIEKHGRSWKKEKPEMDAEFMGTKLEFSENGTFKSLNRISKAGLGSLDGYYWSILDKKGNRVVGIKKNLKDEAYESICTFMIWDSEKVFFLSNGIVFQLKKLTNHSKFIIKKAVRSKNAVTNKLTPLNETVYSPKQIDRFPTFDICNKVRGDKEQQRCFEDVLNHIIYENIDYTLIRGNIKLSIHIALNSQGKVQEAGVKSTIAALNKSIQKHLIAYLHTKEIKPAQKSGTNVAAKFELSFELISR